MAILPGVSPSNSVIALVEDAAPHTPAAPRTIAVEMRRRLGRTAAQEALRNLGLSEFVELGRAPGGYPIFPPGFCGSLSHSRGAAVALVSNKKHYLGLGIDIESSSRTISRRGILRISRPEERESVDSDSRLPLALFCAKEALYKAIFPLCHKFFGFQDASLTWYPELNQFEAKLLLDLGGGFKAGNSFMVKVMWQERWTIAFCAIPATHQI